MVLVVLVLPAAQCLSDGAHGGALSSGTIRGDECHATSVLVFRCFSLSFDPSELVLSELKCDIVNAIIYGSSLCVCLCVCVCVCEGV